MTTVDFFATEPEDSPTRPRLVVSHPGPRPASEPKAPPISNARLAVVMLIVAESMFFAGLIGAYIVFRFGKPVWPPVGVPALPIQITWVNTLVLMASALTMWNAVQAARTQQTPRLRRFILATLGLGIAFVAVQGFEWVQLVGHGLTVSSGPYGTTFFTLIGCHAAHVGVGLLWLGVVGIGVATGWITRGIDVLVETCGIYWGFVCMLWLILFGLVYN
jgi:heme/copper-type cytochrome/quinol oxidase subunit 3